MDFGQFARAKREAASLTQTDIAKALGLSHRSAIAKKESGYHEWSLNDVVGLAKMLKMPASVLLAEWEKQR